MTTNTLTSPPANLRSEAVESFILYLTVEKDSSPHTLSNYRQDLKKLDSFLDEEREWKHITRDDLRAFLLELRKRQYSPRSIARIVGCMKSFFKFMAAEAIIQDNPAEGLARPKVPYTLPKFLPWEQVELLIAAPLMGKRPTKTQRRDSMLLDLLSNTGGRISETLELRLPNVNLGEEPGVRFYGKGKKERSVPLFAETRDRLLDYIQNIRPLFDPGESDLLFVQRGGLPMCRRSFYYAMKRYAETAGISQRVHPHLLRHSFATAMTEGEMPILNLAELLGHASLATTTIYASVTMRRLRETYDRCHPRARG